MSTRKPRVQTVDEWHRELGRGVLWLGLTALMFIVCIATGVIA